MRSRPKATTPAASAATLSPDRPGPTSTLSVDRESGLESVNSSSPSTSEAESVRTEPIRLLICDDHRLLSDALAMLIRMDSGLELLADPFDRAALAVAAVAELKPDVVLMDVDLPGGMNGIEATREIATLSPRTKVLVLSGSGDPDELLVSAIESGAAGFLSKLEAATKVLVAVRAVADGESLLDTATLGWVLKRVSEVRTVRRATDERAGRLTDREKEILQLMSEGESNNDIATSLFLSVHTVHTHVRNVLAKLEVHSKLQAVAWAVKAGVITVGR